MTTIAIEWSPAQLEAIERVRAWLADPAQGTREPNVFRLFGHAGSGKSSIARDLAASVAGQVRFAAYTGKAALVMQQKGCIGATTIHRLIYLPRIKCQERLKELAEKLRAEQDPDRRRELSLLHDEEKANLARPAFTLNTASSLRDAALLVIDECFPAGTRVDVPGGSRPIEQIRPGDLIQNAVGADRITATARKEVHRVLRLHVCGIPAIDVSEGHPFFTARGLLGAGELRPGDRLLRTAEAVRLLRGSSLGFALPAPSSILQRELLRALVGTTAIQDDSIQPGDAPQGRRSEAAVAGLGRPESQKGNGANPQPKPNTALGDADADLGSVAGEEAPTSGAGGQWTRTHEDGDGAGIRSGADADECRGAPWVARQRLSDTLQTGSRRRRSANLHRTGRPFALRAKEAGAGPQERRETAFARVDRIEVLEQRDPRLDRLRDADGRIYFYDLQATRHSSFSVEGLLVHNCSMVGQDIGNDLLSFQVPILAIGDPAQLPPVKARGFFTDPRQEPDLMLEEIHRQAEGSPVLRLATLARRGEQLPYGRYGASRVASRMELSLDDATKHDQIICGRNATRAVLNARIRAHKNLVGTLPQPGDRVVCRRNDYETGLLNGSLWQVVDSEEIDSERCYLTIKDPDALAHLTVEAHRAPFEGREVPYYERRDAQLFEFGWAITCHLSQGSQWRSVCVVDESGAFKGDAHRWLYTSLTRASERVTVIR